MYIDVFNGDADGICSLHQLRLAEPRTATLVTGVKRDIRLLQKVSNAKNAELTVLDISMESNKSDLTALLGNNTVLYIDHHYPGSIPDSPNLTAHIDVAPDVCTAIIVDRLLKGRYRAWAVVAGFGDNLHDAARSLAMTLGLTEDQANCLRELGELINYNGYGKTVADLHFSPETLYDAVRHYEDPLEFYFHSETLSELQDGFHSDMQIARNQDPLWEGSVGRIFKFTGEPWSRRVAGVFSNEKARELPDHAHALLVDNNDKTFMVSVRAPLNKRTGADVLCRAFPTGGGRAAAAGINALPEEQLDIFVNDFKSFFSK